MTRRAPAPIASLVGLLAVGAAAGAGAQEAPDSTAYPPVGRQVAMSLRFPELEFEQPEARREEVRGVTVLFLRDETLPLVDIYARFKGGFSLFSREYYAAATAVPSLLRSGGTRSLAPDSVDQLVEFYALQTTFGSGGESAFSHLNTLTETLEPALELWGEMLREPGFDRAQVEVWRGRTLERVRRRTDNPQRLAFSEFNRIMFGDHPTGWEMAPRDLEPSDLSPRRLRWVHGRVFCTDNLILGITGDLTWSRARELVDGMLSEWPDCPEELAESPEADPRREGGVFLIPRELNQSTVVMAGPGGVRRAADPEYYSSRIANSILGASGFTSRLLSRVRTERGLAYSASSLWTAPSSSEGIVGAVTQTKSETTVAATRLILSIMEEMKVEAPRRDEVRTAVDEIVNGFVFNFQDPGQVVSRQMYYMAQDLPEDWLERYVEGIQEVTPADVRDVMSRHVDPGRMTILILGDSARFDMPLDSLGRGPATILEVDLEVESVGAGEGPATPSGPRGSPRSPG